jgi:type II secretion system protein J
MKRPDAHQPHRGIRGFTLIEVMIATLIFATIMAALNTVFFGAFRLRASTVKTLEDSIPLNHAASIIKADLRGIVAPGLMITNPITTTPTSMNTMTKGVNDGGLNRLEIYTSTAVTDNEKPWNDIQKVSYYLRQSDRPLKVVGKDLIRAITRNLLPTTEEDITEQVILTGVGMLEFTFFDGTEWRELWDTASELETQQQTQSQTQDQTQDQTQTQSPLPLAVRVRIGFAAENARRNSLRADKLPLEILAPIVVQGRSNTVSTASAATSAQPAANTGGNTGGGNTGGGNTGGGNTGGGNTGGGNTGGGRGAGGRGG